MATDDGAAPPPSSRAGPTLALAIDREKIVAGLAEEQNLWRLMGLDLPELQERAHAGAIASKPLLDEVRTLCLFIGYQRSGHSLVGSLLDAHPQMAIAHELDALFYLKRGFHPREILYLMLEVSRMHGELGRRWGEYTYRVPGQWQGRHTQLAVIGDKKGGMTTLRIARNPALLKQVMTRFGKRKRFIHVLRNPYDNIAAMVQHGQSLKAAVGEYFKLLRTNRAIIKRVGADAVATVHHEDLVADPRGELSRLCEFLGVTAPPDYLEACASIVFAAPRQPRHKIPWHPETLGILERRIATKPMIERYRFAD
ncbi:sulfotransferase family protein [Hypericibacter sp.]|uniref:sulfotransferase family protein n=1 Tax=Hypericibacter sp. TaxID=2705401 RepID=UPI003D6D7B84